MHSSALLIGRLLLIQSEAGEMQLRQQSIPNQSKAPPPPFSSARSEREQFFYIRTRMLMFELDTGDATQRRKDLHTPCRMDQKLDQMCLKSSLKANSNFDRERVLFVTTYGDNNSSSLFHWLYTDRPVFRERRLHLRQRFALSITRTCVLLSG
uniref:Uncharacterized protein n=1 Tax=Octactis speculum TaxID=3111310 RepID=A0A7S2D673_9STRA|mmetsp:Transcript_44055/g.60165  ORF Transcript_44055/g.60165 Transcript_44055/m.60165 type:complete len:153 (+) Transcript_44055:761-1219(+)